MTTKTEGYHAGHFIVSEANGHRSRETITVAAGEVLVAGSVIAKHSGTGKYAEYDNDATVTLDDAAGILYDNVDATDGDVEAVAIVRDAEVNGDELQWGANEDTNDRLAGTADLLALGIIVR